MFDDLLPVTMAGSFGLSDAPTSAPPSSSDSGFLSGAMQSAMALGTGYLSRRIDIDLQQRLAGSQPAAKLQGNQVTAAVDGAIAGMRLSTVLPFAVLLVGAYLIFKR
jgi:hypothetical protein